MWGGSRRRCSMDAGALGWTFAGPGHLPDATAQPYPQCGGLGGRGSARRCCGRRLVAVGALAGGAAGWHGLVRLAAPHGQAHALPLTALTRCPARSPADTKWRGQLVTMGAGGELCIRTPVLAAGIEAVLAAGIEATVRRPNDTCAAAARQLCGGCVAAV